ncbi:hypothetical protein PENSPDRAFT_677433 [Peniophora sp. CONT]|nr:hypothetical protein PENSPDRAFT_677433 [Peniophora sp. CONT]
MPPRSREKCGVCRENISKYSCPKCSLLYCSIPCFKSHKGSAFARLIPAPPLRRLASLNWPYVPDEPSHPDPLKRDDPKPLNMRQYESIARSPAVRAALAAHPRLNDILRTIEGLRGTQREEAIQRGLGVAADDQGGRYRSGGRPDDDTAFVSNEDKEALRQLAEAVEGAVRGGEGGLGLDWGD